jgi:adenine-specific DNA-methyltransferase
VYALRKDAWTRNLLPRTAKADANYRNPDKDPRGVWTSSDLSARNFYSLGSYSVETPKGTLIPGPPPGRYWTISKERFDELDADNRIWWGASGDNQPRFKRFLTDVRDGVVPQTVWSHEEVGHTQEAKKEMLGFDSEEVFGTPKPERLINRIVEIATNPNDLILDSFLGSGTTAAVAQKMGRRWIGIEMGEHAKRIAFRACKK